tara:strand:+ start:140 stop:382 length:243 start_codon:yes stop_codon:yes gene_type:complete
LNRNKSYSGLQWDWFKAGLTSGFDIYIRDMKGAQIQKVNIDNHQVNTEMLRLNGLTPGIYLLSVESGDEVLHQTKLTIQK